MAGSKQGNGKVLTGLRVHLISDPTQKGMIMSHATLEKFKRGPRWKQYRDLVAVLWDCPEAGQDGTIAKVTFEKMRNLAVEGKDAQSGTRGGKGASTT